MAEHTFVVNQKTTQGILIHYQKKLSLPNTTRINWLSWNKFLGGQVLSINLSIKHLATMIYRIIKCFHWDNLKTLEIKFTEIYKFQHKEICVKKLLWVYTQSLRVFQIAGVWSFWSLSVVHSTVQSCHLRLQSTFYSCLNVKELLARSRLEISSLSDCNWTRTQKSFWSLSVGL